jgi:HEAT repeat protein
LILSLKDKSPAVRSAAVSAFFKIGPAGETAVPQLIELLDDKLIAQEAAMTLGRMGVKAKPATPALIRLLKTAEGYERLHAAEALWLIDQDYDTAVPALIESLKDPYLPILCDAARVLGKIGPRASAAVPALVAVRDHKPKPRSKREVRKPKDDSPPVVEEMPEEEFYPVVRDAAVEALSKVKGGE